MGDTFGFVLRKDTGKVRSQSRIVFCKTLRPPLLVIRRVVFEPLGVVFRLVGDLIFYVCFVVIESR